MGKKAKDKISLSHLDIPPQTVSTKTAVKNHSRLKRLWKWLAALTEILIINNGTISLKNRIIPGLFEAVNKLTHTGVFKGLSNFCSG